MEKDTLGVGKKKKTQAFPQKDEKPFRYRGAGELRHFKAFRNYVLMFLILILCARYLSKTTGRREVRFRFVGIIVSGKLTRQLVYLPTINSSTFMDRIKTKRECAILF